MAVAPQKVSHDSFGPSGFDAARYPDLALYAALHPEGENASDEQPVAVQHTTDILGSGWRAEVAAALVALGYTAAADKFLQCGKKTVAVVTCPHDINHTARPVCEHCDERICPYCAARLAARLLEHYAAPIEKIISDHPRSGYRLRHLVLTTDIHPMDAGVEVRYDQVRDAIEPTIRDCICPQKDGETAREWRERWREKKRTLGWLENDEFGEEGQKLHFHIAYYGPFIPQAVLSKLWNTHTGYSIVYITNRQDAPIRDVLKETLKYVTKFAVDGQAAKPNLVAQVFHILHGRRRVRSKGLFYNIPPTPEEEEEHGLCPECQKELEVIQIGKFLERTNTYIKALQMEETTPDLSLEVLGIVASAAQCSHIDIMFSARRQWQEIWNGSEHIPDVSEYDLARAGPEATPP